MRMRKLIGEDCMNGQLGTDLIYRFCVRSQGSCRPGAEPRALGSTGNKTKLSVMASKAQVDNRGILTQSRHAPPCRFSPSPGLQPEPRSRITPSWAIFVSGSFQAPLHVLQVMTLPYGPLDRPRSLSNKAPRIRSHCSGTLRRTLPP